MSDNQTVLSRSAQVDEASVSLEGSRFIWVTTKRYTDFVKFHEDLSIYIRMK